MIPGNRQRNYLQSALYVVIAGTLAATLLERLLTYAEVAEKAAMEATLSRLHTGLYARVAMLALRGEYEALEALQNQSPFTAAQVLSANYLGEFVGVPEGNAAVGKWFYDRLRRELIYVPSLKRHLHPDRSEGATTGLRFRMHVRKPSMNVYGGVAIEPVGSARWEPSP